MNWEEYLEKFPPSKWTCLRGHLPAPLIDRLRDAVLNAPKIQFNTEPVEGVEIVAVNGDEVEQLNKDHEYRDLDEPTKDVLRQILPHVLSGVGVAWRVLNVRSWTTKAGAVMGPNDWHMDGDHPGIVKLMLYGTPTGGQYGGLEWKGGKLNGESWLLFYSSVIEHKAIAPTKEGLERVATEVTLCPSKEFDLEPKFLGLAARKPLVP